MGKLKIYMVKKNGKYYLDDGWLGSWVSDPEEASVWPSHTNLSPILTIHPGSEITTMEAELP